MGIVFYRLESLITTGHLAEAVRFELTEHFCSAVFKTAGLNHSPKPPMARMIPEITLPAKALLVKIFHDAIATFTLFM